MDIKNQKTNMPKGVYQRKNKKSYYQQCLDCDVLLGKRNTKGYCLSCSHKRNPTRYWLGKKRPDIKEFATGRRPSNETRKKLSESHKGKTSYWKGRKRPEMTGEKHPLWRGGKATEKKRKCFAELRRRAKKLENGGSHTIEDWENLKKKFNFMCLCCKRFEPEIKLTQDHILPVSLGGSDDIDNIQPLCWSCNSSKYQNIINYKELHYVK